jgi:hypothetical protein
MKSFKKIVWKQAASLVLIQGEGGPKLAFRERSGALAFYIHQDKMAAALLQVPDLNGHCLKQTGVHAAPISNVALIAAVIQTLPNVRGVGGLLHLSTLLSIHTRNASLIIIVQTAINVRDFDKRFPIMNCSIVDFAF